MIAKGSIVESYAKADFTQRVDIIFRNYAGFMNKISGYEDGLRYVIINERNYNRCRTNGDPGIRVQKSGLSDPTSQDGIDEVMLEKAMETGDMDRELRFTDYPKRYKREADVLSVMKGDYGLVTSMIHTLNPDDEKILMQYLRREKDFYELAEELGIQYASAKLKISRMKKTVRDLTVEYINQIRMEASDNDR